MSKKKKEQRPKKGETIASPEAVEGSNLEEVEEESSIEFESDIAPESNQASEEEEVENLETEEEIGTSKTVEMEEDVEVSETAEIEDIEVSENVEESKFSPNREVVIQDATIGEESDDENDPEVIEVSETVEIDDDFETIIESVKEGKADTNDLVLEDDALLAAFKQSEGTVLWRVDGLYDEEGNLHKKSYLKQNPPLFSIEDSNGDIAEFFVTQNLAFSLKEVFEKVYKGYYGVTQRKKSFDPETGVTTKFGFKDYVKDNPLQVGFLVLVVIMVILMSFVF